MAKSTRLDELFAALTSLVKETTAYMTEARVSQKDRKVMEKEAMASLKRAEDLVMDKLGKGVQQVKNLTDHPNTPAGPLSESVALRDLFKGKL